MSVTVTPHPSSPLLSIVYSLTSLNPLPLAPLYTRQHSLISSTVASPARTLWQLILRPSSTATPIWARSTLA